MDFIKTSDKTFCRVKIRRGWFTARDNFFAIYVENSYDGNKKSTEESRYIGLFIFKINAGQRYGSVDYVENGTQIRKEEFPLDYSSTCQLVRELVKREYTMSKACVKQDEFFNEHDIVIKQKQLDLVFDEFYFIYENPKEPNLEEND